MVIHIDYANTQKNGDVFVPFTVVTGIAFSSDAVKNVTVDNGSVISEGKSTVVMGMAFPGLKESIEPARQDTLDIMDQTDGRPKTREKIEDLDIPESVEIKLDAEEFRMSTCMTLVLSTTFEDEDLDEEHSGYLEDMDEKIKDLQDGGEELQDGAKELSDGIGEVDDSMPDLTAGADELADGVWKYTKGVNQLGDGASTLTGGLSELNGKLPAFTQGVTSYTEGVKQVDEGLGSLTGGIPGLTEGTSSLHSGLKDFGDGMNTLTKGLMDLADGTQKLADNSDSLNKGLSDAAAGVKGLSDGAAQLYYAVTVKAEEGDPSYPAGGLQEALKNYTNGAGKLYEGLKQLDDSLSNEEQGLGKAAEALRDGIREYTGGFKFCE